VSPTPPTGDNRDRCSTFDKKMDAQERREFINKIDTEFSKNERARLAKNGNLSYIREEFTYNLDAWIEDINKRIEQFPDVKQTLMFEKYIICSLYDTCQKLRNETDKLFAQN